MSIYFAILLFTNINYTLLEDKQSFLSLPVVIASAKQENISNTEDENIKEPTATLLIALFPGFFFHGLGHFYIGENKTGRILLE